MPALPSSQTGWRGGRARRCCAADEIICSCTIVRAGLGAYLADPTDTTPTTRPRGYDVLSPAVRHVGSAARLRLMQHSLVFTLAHAERRLRPDILPLQTGCQSCLERRLGCAPALSQHTPSCTRDNCGSTSRRVTDAWCRSITEREINGAAVVSDSAQRCIMAAGNHAVRVHVMHMLVFDGDRSSTFGSLIRQRRGFGSVGPYEIRRTNH
jgi:hypothetical protein